MSDAIYYCKCGYKCLESSLAKSDGYCPVCKFGRQEHVAKYDSSKSTKKVS